MIYKIVCVHENWVILSVCMLKKVWVCVFFKRDKEKELRKFETISELIILLYESTYIKKSFLDTYFVKQNFEYFWFWNYEIFLDIFWYIFFKFKFDMFYTYSKETHTITHLYTYKIFKKHTSFTLAHIFSLIT